MVDIGSRSDIDHLLRVFYGRALTDGQLHHHFVDVAHMDLEAHLPQIGNFWEKVLFNTSEYDGQAMRVHRRLHQLEPLTPPHFTRWLELWGQALDAVRRAGRRAGEGARGADRRGVHAQAARERPGRAEIPLSAVRRPGA